MTLDPQAIRSIRRGTGIAGPLTTSGWWRVLSERLRCDWAILGLIPDHAVDGEDQDSELSPDLYLESVLAIENITGDEIRGWIGELAWQGVLRAAGPCGIHRTVLDDGPIQGHMVIARYPSWPGSQRGWYLVVGRRDRGFSEDEVQLVGIVLADLSRRIELPGELGLERRIFNAAGELLFEDAASGGVLPRRASEIIGLERVAAVVERRWDRQKDHHPYDLILDVDGQPHWFRVARHQVAAGLPPTTWIEMRPLGNDDPPPVEHVEDERINQALGFLSDRFADAPSLSELADRLNMSAFHFHRLFRREVDISPKQYVLRMQMMVAKWLLRTRSLPIGEIAYATGFRSHGHFTATFSRIVGMSPSTFREACEPS